jgi:hypothetical protein
MRLSIRHLMALWGALLILGVAGCSSGKSTAGSSSSDHYVEVPPQTGSMIHRRVKVDENGKAVDPADAGAVRSIDPASLDRLRPVSNPAGAGH